MWGGGILRNTPSCGVKWLTTALGQPRCSGGAVAKTLPPCCILDAAPSEVRGGRRGAASLSPATPTVVRTGKVSVDLLHAPCQCEVGRENASCVLCALAARSLAGSGRGSARLLRPGFCALSAHAVHSVVGGGRGRRLLRALTPRPCCQLPAAPSLARGRRSQRHSVVGGGRGRRLLRALRRCVARGRNRRRALGGARQVRVQLLARCQDEAQE